MQGVKRGKRRRGKHGRGEKYNEGGMRGVAVERGNMKEIGEEHYKEEI